MQISPWIRPGSEIKQNELVLFRSIKKKKLVQLLIQLRIHGTGI
jgi:hypothetical protein